MDAFDPALLQAQTAALLDDAIAVQQVAAPTFAERARAEMVERRFAELGLKDVSRDGMDNVLGRLPGGGGPGLLVSAHLDTVFGPGTDLSVRHEGGRVHGPGIGDNSLAVAALLALPRALAAHGLRLPGDLWLAANVGEEGLGDLRGMKAVLDALSGRVGAAVVLEGMGFGSIVHQGIGVRRYRVTVRAPGGHSWGDFGAPSAVHRAVELGARLNRLRVPETPKTTFNIGVIKGGTSVNTIAPSAMMEIDLRSEGDAELDALVADFERALDAFDAAGAEVAAEVIGNRPAGAIARDHWLVGAAQRALRAVGVEEIDYRPSSTDANVPLSRGLPSVCVGLTQGGNPHRTDEYIETAPLARGFEQLLSLVCAASEQRNAPQRGKEDS